jgi:hypothetical protein
MAMMELPEVMKSKTAYWRLMLRGPILALGFTYYPSPFSALSSVTIVLA